MSAGSILMMTPSEQVTYVGHLQRRIAELERRGTLLTEFLEAFEADASDLGAYWRRRSAARDALTVAGFPWAEGGTAP